MPKHVVRIKKEGEKILTDVAHRRQKSGMQNRIYTVQQDAAIYCDKNLLSLTIYIIYFVRFEVFTAVTMKNAVFWDVALVPRSWIFLP
jgi:hypothetical protein